MIVINNINKYVNPSVTVDTLVFAINTIINNDVRKLNDKKLQVLLIKRDKEPYKNKWSIPGGFIVIDEDLDEAANRILKQKTNIDEIYVEQLYTWGNVNRDPRCRVISTSYMALINKDDTYIENANMKWFDIKVNILDEKREDLKDGYILNKEIELLLISDKENYRSKLLYITEYSNKNIKESIKVLKSDYIAFDHLKVIYYGLLRMRNKIEYTDIVFNLLPDKFTLAELQQVFEVIMDKVYTKPNFQRKIKLKVISTESIKKGGFRPAKLYKYNKDWNN